MPALTPATVKLKSTLRLLIPRLRNAQKKDTALSVAARREMADLLATNREASARIRVENIIHTDITVELMEILELYAELLLARSAMLDLRDKLLKEGGDNADETQATGLEEAAASLVYAAPRLPRDIKELGLVRNLLIERFGKEWTVKVSENAEGEMVPKRVTEKLKMDVPKEALVQAYLEEIARSYAVDWPRRNYELENARDEVDDEDDDDGGPKEQPILADGAQSVSTPSKAPGKVDLSNLNSVSATPPKGLDPEGARSPVSVAPPGARTDNPTPSVKLPGGGTAAPKKSSAANASKGSGAAKAGGPGGSVPTVDDLAKRFSALKR
ncbi:Vacuolar protein sorting-associated protein IST1 [Cyphellophora attinorum]|uniref:Vacuolar protein sorting-associated protein IST1 n=1 Tax=Cyphellophora attinorum TaxID=1664694 RepID=A0A0N1HA33_9EURO|nr:Vacuolar protein sorting-associated protein IST1 [Phialophora attinorum]KPI40582.1 Vacuolar protein sorting-associated protein IST1 [Phialophora attinorum]